MIQKIHIENFRCFEQFELDGFSRVNLFGGMNNAGKTALLEGMYLGESSQGFKLSNIQMLRNDGFDKSGRTFQPYRPLFKDINKPFLINTIHDNREFLSCYYHSHHNIPVELQSEQATHQEYINFENLYVAELMIVKSEKSPIANFSVNDYGLDIRDFVVQYIPASFKHLNNFVFRRFLSDEDRGQTLNYLEVLRMIDSHINVIRTRANDTRLFIEKKGVEGLLPLNTLGDAAVKAVNYVSFFGQPLTEVLLIDEIENGLHYTKQEEFWKMLFTLAKQRNVQIFATTHSLEMIKAFNKVAIENKWDEEAKYFEMYRQEDNDKIRATKRDMEELRFDLEGGYPIRG